MYALAHRRRGKDCHFLDTCSGAGNDDYSELTARADALHCQGSTHDRSNWKSYRRRRRVQFVHRNRAVDQIGICHLRFVRQWHT